MFSKEVGIMPLKIVYCKNCAKRMLVNDNKEIEHVKYCSRKSCKKLRGKK